MIKQSVKRFLRSEYGAITVDWVVLTASVVALAGAVILAIQDGSDSVGEGVGDFLTDSNAGNF